MQCWEQGVLSKGWYSVILKISRAFATAITHLNSWQTTGWMLLGLKSKQFFFLSFFTGCCSTQLEHSQFPDPGSNRGPLQGKLRALPTGPPGNPPVSYFNKYFINQEKKKKSHLTKKKKKWESVWKRTQGVARQLYVKWISMRVNCR